MSTRPSSMPLARILQAGVVAGAGLLFAGGLLALFQGELHTGGGDNWLVETGVLVLIFTPALRVIASGILLGRSRDHEPRDWVAVTCAVLVLALLALAFALDLGAHPAAPTGDST